MSAKKKVLVFGGGIGGLSLAHELTNGPRAGYFDVEVIEARDICGGKAISEDVAGHPAASHPFPGEHGFRFFPSFYEHVVDTMTGIPSFDGRSVEAHLVPTPSRMIARADATPIVMPSAPNLHSLSDITAFISAIFGSGVQFAPGEVGFFARKLIRLATSCRDRRLNQYETISWWEFLEADDPSKSDNYRKYLARGLTRTLVAAQPHEINAMTGGDVLLRLLIDTGVSGKAKRADRVLDGPTSRVWITPWKAHLESKGVVFTNAALYALNLATAGGMIASADVVKSDGTHLTRGADYFVAALPVEQMAEVLDRCPAVVAAGQRLDGIVNELRKDVRQMTGLQFYLDGTFVDIPKTMGHQLYVDSQWALTSIAQSNFWAPPYDDLTMWGDGDLKTVWSTIFSDWTTPFPDVGGAPAESSDAAALREGVLQQLERALNFGTKRFDRSQIVASNIDRAMTPGSASTIASSSMPLLVNRPGRWQVKPDPAPAGIANLFLAADYVRTGTALATMEAANEAARLAANAMLVAENVPGPHCKTWDLYYPEALAGNQLWDVIIEADQVAFELGLDWSLPPFFSKFSSPFTFQSMPWF